VRRDGFKGFSKAQTQGFYKENEALAAEKRAADDAGQQDAAWFAHSQQLASLIEAAEAERAYEARATAATHRAALEAQAAEQKEREAASKANRFGGVGAGYFDGFGTSVR
jgi:hypothetical protein